MPIVPIEPFELDPRTDLMFEIADIINDAISGPTIGVVEVAVMILDAVEKRNAQ